MTFSSLDKLCDLRNKIYWQIFGDTKMAKYCKQTGGFVTNDYQCEGCAFCGNTSKEDKEEAQNSSKA